MFHVIAGALLLAGTLLQAHTSLRDLQRTHREAVEHWEAEEELLRGVRWWHRRRARRKLVARRDPELRARLTHVEQVLYGWLLIVLAAATTLLAALT